MRKGSDTSDTYLRSHPDAKDTKCICPLCGKKYTIKFVYLGRGRMRKYCSKCLIQAGRKTDFAHSKPNKIKFKSQLKLEE